MSEKTLKKSYTVPCSSLFRDQIEALAARRQVNVGDLARSVLLMAPSQTIANWPDPGEPAIQDRESVLLKSGPGAGRPWRRKPRLQVRMPPGHGIIQIRKALGLALAISEGKAALSLVRPGEEPERIVRAKAEEEIERLRTVVSVLAFEPLPDGVHTRQDALHVLGFPPDATPDAKVVRAKFRMLATIHHPDNSLGSHQRMSQLNQAMDVLRRSAAR